MTRETIKMVSPRYNDFDRAVLSMFAEKLATFAASLSEDERYILAARIMDLMDPMERSHWKNVNKLLNAKELATLCELDEKA